MLGVGEQSWQMALQRLGGVDQRAQARVRGPEVPAIEELLRCAGVVIVPEISERFLDRPSPTDLERVELWRPQGDSNPCYRRERAMS